MPANLLQRCRQDFSLNARNNGEVYSLHDRVRLLQQTAQSASASVNGSAGNTYRVELDWSAAESDGVLSAICTCPHYDGGAFCKHIYAVLFELQQNGKAPSISGNDPLTLVRADDDAGLDDDAPDSGRDDPLDDLIYQYGRNPSLSVAKRAFDLVTQRAAAKTGGRKTAASGAKKLAAWRGVVKSAARGVAEHRSREPGGGAVKQNRSNGRLLYLVDIDVALNTGDFAIDFYQEIPRKTGGWRAPKRFKINSERLERFDLPTDRQLAALFIGHRTEDARHRYYGYSGSSYGSYGAAASFSRAIVQPALYDDVIPRLVATGRFGWFRDSGHSKDASWRPLSWDDGPPYALHCRFEECQKPAGWRLTGHLVRDGEEISLAQPLLLLRHGLVLFDDRLARLEPGDFDWLAALRASRNEVTIPAADADAFADAVWSADAPPPCEMPPELRYEVIEAAPQARLAVRPRNKRYAYYGAKDELDAELTFRYGPTVIDRNHSEPSLIDRSARRVLRRDRAAEVAAAARLAQLGVRRTHVYYHDQAEYSVKESLLPTVARTLTAEGWEVEAQGLKIKPAGELRLNVKSSVDWFDLEGGCDFGGQHVGVPEILAALRRGDNFVKLADGTQGILPEAWLAQLRRLSELGEATDGVLRFKPNQALLLDALLASMPACDVDAKFRDLRQRLKSFAGVEPHDPPAGFAGTLRQYQREGLGWLGFLRDLNLGGCLADDMGLGKTVQVLGALDARRVRRLKKNETRRPSLVVVPRSLIHNWLDEAAHFTPRLKLLNYTGLERAELLPQIGDHHALVTTYGTLRRDIDKLREVRFDYAILDEAQAVKNSAAQASKAVRLLQADHRLAMTGTPVENHLGELWSLFEFLNPGMLGASSLLQDLTRGPAAADGLAQLAAALRPFILRRTKQQVLSELPEKTEQTIFCELEGPQRKAYNELRDHYRAKLSKQVAQRGLNQSRIHVLEALLRLRQAACHPGLLDKNRHDDPSAKFDTLFEQLTEILAEGHKALIFSQFTSLLALVRGRLDAQGVNYAYLDGATRKRKEPVERFQTDPDCPLFLISLKAGGQGLNLTAADYVFILDPWWNPAVEAQAVDRAHRIGQTRPVFAYRLIARDTVEEKILELQRDKRQLAEAIISADAGPLSSLTADDIERLLS